MIFCEYEPVVHEKTPCIEISITDTYFSISHRLWPIAKKSFILNVIKLFENELGGMSTVMRF